MFLLGNLFFFIFLQALFDELFHFRGDDLTLPISRSLRKGSVLTLTVLLDCVPGNPQPPGYLPLRKPFYCIESSDKLVLIHFDHLLTSCTRSGGTFNVQEFDQSGSLLRQRFPQKWISFMLAFTAAHGAWNGAVGQSDLPGFHIDHAGVGQKRWF